MLVGPVSLLGECHEPKGCGTDYGLDTRDASAAPQGRGTVPMPMPEPSVTPTLEDEFEADAEEESVAGFDSDESPVRCPGLYAGLCPGLCP